MSCKGTKEISSRLAVYLDNFRTPPENKTTASLVLITVIITKYNENMTITLAVNPIYSYRARCWVGALLSRRNHKCVDVPSLGPLDTQCHNDFSSPCSALYLKKQVAVRNLALRARAFVLLANGYTRLLTKTVGACFLVPRKKHTK